jgi:hypothetical protein
MSSQVDRKTLEEHYLHTDPSDDRSGSSATVDRAMKSCSKEREKMLRLLFLPSAYIHASTQPGSHTYIHAHPWRIGEEQGGIVGEGEENIRRETFCTSAGRDMRWAGRCMYVCEYVHTIRCMGCGICISLSAASLTLPLAAMSAPFSRRREQIPVWP